MLGNKRPFRNPPTAGVQMKSFSCFSIPWVRCLGDNLEGEVDTFPGLFKLIWQIANPTLKKKRKRKIRISEGSWILLAIDRDLLS